MESTFSYTLEDLRGDVLEYQGVGRDNADADVMAKATRRVNDGYRKFLVLDWAFLSKQAVLTVEAGKDTYELPDDFAVIRVPFKCFSGNNYANPAEDTVSNIWGKRMYAPQSGPPTRFTFIDEYTEESGIRKKVVFWPTPSNAISYNYEYKVFPNELVNDDDIPYCPANLSHVLREFCLAEVELFDEEGAKTAHTSQLFQVLLPQAIRENSIRTPNTVGELAPQYSPVPFGTKATVYGQEFQY
jgi:hypothetical protein